MPRKKIEDPELTPAAEEIAGGDILMETDIPPEETESDEYTAPAYESEDGESPPAAETGDTGGDGPTDAEAEEPAPIEVLVPADDPPLEENLQGGETAPGDSMPLGDPVQEPAPSERVEKPTPRASRKKKPPGVESVPAEVPPETPKPGATSRRRTSAPPVLTVEAHDEVETQADREDVVWHEIHNAYRTRKILTGVLGGIEQLENHKTLVIVYYKEFRIAIPMSEMMLNIAGTEGQNYDELMRRQNKLLNNMLGAEIDFMVKGIDAKARSVVASRKDAMLKKRRTFYM
ncbi:MAG: RNA-binding protein, partial [Oscillospiraceae bacterium]|nr:RNA-binding protein [Oscillospiraceae bacterium]